MTEVLESQHAVAQHRAAMSIRVSAGIGEGSTELSAFDAALRTAGVENFNLVRLSSVIPPHADVSEVTGIGQLRGEWGDRLYCVYAEQRASVPGENAWAGIGWVLRNDHGTGGLFVEHEGPSREYVADSIADSLADLAAGRPQTFGRVHTKIVGTRCVDRPVCALVVASYETQTWRRTPRQLDLAR